MYILLYNLYRTEKGKKIFTISPDCLRLWVKGQINYIFYILLAYSGYFVFTFFMVMIANYFGGV